MGYVIARVACVDEGGNQRQVSERKRPEYETLLGKFTLDVSEQWWQFLLDNVAD